MRNSYQEAYDSIVKVLSERTAGSHIGNYSTMGASNYHLKQSKQDTHYNLF